MSTFNVEPCPLLHFLNGVLLTLLSILRLEVKENLKMYFLKEMIAAVYTYVSTDVF